MSFFTQIATYLTGKLNPIIKRLNVLSSILPFPDRVNSGGKGYVFQVKQDQSGYQWKQTPKLAPFIQSANPTLLDIDQTGIIVTVKGSGFDPNTIFDLGDNITVQSIENVSPSEVKLTVDTGSLEQHNVVKAFNGGTESFGNVEVQTKDVTVIVPDNSGGTLWENQTSNITTGLGFVEAGNVSGWNKSATFNTAVANTDFILSFNMIANGSAYAMVGVNIANTTSSYSDIDFAFYRSGTNVNIYETGSSRGGFGAVTDATKYEIKRTGTTLEYLIDGNVIRTVNNATTGALIFDCSIYRNMRIENIQIMY